MLRQLVRFRITTYVKTMEKAKESEGNLIDTLDIIESIYADEWCLQLTGRDFKCPREHKDGLKFPIRCDWLFDTSRTTLDYIMECFDKVEPNNDFVYYIETTD